MNNKNWEEIYEAILKDVVVVVEDSSKGADRKIDRITEILVSNDFMEKTYEDEHGSKTHTSQTHHTARWVPRCGIPDVAGID